MHFTYTTTHMQLTFLKLASWVTAAKFGEPGIVNKYHYHKLKLVDSIYNFQDGVRVLISFRSRRNTSCRELSQSQTALAKFCWLDYWMTYDWMAALCPGETTAQCNREHMDISIGCQAACWLSVLWDQPTWRCAWSWLNNKHSRLAQFQFWLDH